MAKPALATCDRIGVGTFARRRELDGSGHVENVSTLDLKVFTFHWRDAARTCEYQVEPPAFFDFAFR